ncbi:MAG: hypothetical protein ACREEC_10255, partial [Thermoplasmata archaeon]
MLRMDVRDAIVKHLGGLDLTWPRPVQHPKLPELPDHLPVLVQAYPEQVDVAWIALHGSRLFGVAGKRLTPKHHRPLREVYRLAPTTKLAVEFFVEDRVLEGIWHNRAIVIHQLRQLDLDLVLTPSYSVWIDDVRFSQLRNIRRAFLSYHLLIEAGIPAVPDIGFSYFEPDGRLWAEWINSQPDLEAVSLFCGGKKIHASKRALRETLEDVALFHRAVRRDVTFILGGVHAPDRLRLFRAAAPGRRLVVCNGMAYALAQRRRLLGAHSPIARSSRDCFLLNCAANDREYARVLNQDL